MPRPATHRVTTLARRRALLDAAIEVIAEQGIGRATHREIARRAGLPLGTTSYFFDSIEDLVLEAQRVFSQELLARIDALRALLADQRMTPRQAIDGLADVLLAEPAAQIISQFDVYLHATRQPELRDAVAAVIAGFEALTEAALTAAGARRPHQAARAFVALIDGFALHRVTWPRGEQDREALREGLHDLFLSQTLTSPEHNDLQARLDEPPEPAAT
jgi:DNA-binding transcriptional regulator YbjK